MYPVCINNGFDQDPTGLGLGQSYIYQVLQTIQMKLILLCVWQSYTYQVL